MVDVDDFSYWSKTYSYQLINDEVTVKDLQETLRENNSFYEIIDNDSRWIAFAEYTALKHNLSEYQVISFKYIISIFMCKEPLSEGARYYYDEELIINDVIGEYLALLNSSDLFEEEKLIRLFNYILELYKVRLDDFSVAQYSIKLPLSEEDYLNFLNVPGEDNMMRFHNLLHARHELNIARIHIFCPSMYLKDVDDLYTLTCSVFDEMEYDPDLDLLDWAVNFVETKDYSPREFYPAASVLVDIYCLLENYNL